LPKGRTASLDAIARWFQESVVRPHEAGKRGRKLADASTVILPSKTLTPERRVAIYAEAYLARLIEALHDDFPAVTQFQGHDAFHELCRSYLERHPSRSWSLNPLGRKLPEFLSGKVRIPRREATRDLAALEVAMSEVFDEKTTEPLTPEDFAKLPPERFIGARLRFVPAFRLLALDHDVNPYVDAVRQERESRPPLRRKKTWIAVYRKEYKVWRLDLREGAHAALSALLRGRSVESAVAAAARTWKGKPADLPAQIRQWFGEWASEGFFAQVLK
jgi:hypothetical protein